MSTRRRRRKEEEEVEEEIEEQVDEEANVSFGGHSYGASAEEVQGAEDAEVSEISFSATTESVSQYHAVDDAERVMAAEQE